MGKFWKGGGYILKTSVSYETYSLRSLFLWTHGELNPDLVHAMDAFYRYTMGPNEKDNTSISYYLRTRSPKGFLMGPSVERADSNLFIAISQPKNFALSSSIFFWSCRASRKIRSKNPSPRIFPETTSSDKASKETG